MCPGHKNKTLSGLVTMISSDITVLQNQNTCSSSEHVIGKWTNGKPLYEKVITFSGSINNTGITYSHGIANVDMIYVDNVIMGDAGEGESADTHYWAYSAISVKVNRTVLSIRNGITGVLAGTHMAILRYTKTTDT